MSRPCFDNDGYHVQFNVLDTAILRDAQKHPENYRDLVVRVAGFSAFFTKLAPGVQDEIIARTLQTFGSIGHRSSGAAWRLRRYRAYRSGPATGLI